MDWNQRSNRLLSKTSFLIFSVVLLLLFIGGLKVAADTAPEPQVIEDGKFKYKVLVNAENAVGVFEYFGDEKEVTIPGSIDGYPYNVVAIGVHNGDEVFKNKSLTSVNFPDTIRDINTSVFEDNKLTNLQLPSNLRSILHYAFANNRLTEVNFPKSVELVGVGSFSGNPLTKITIPAGLDFIDDEAFANNKSGGKLEVIIHSKNAEFGSDVFTGFSSPDKVTIIGKQGSTAETYARDNGHTFISLDAPKTEEGNIPVKPGDSVDISFSGEHMATLKIPKAIKSNIDTLEVEVVKNGNTPEGYNIAGVILNFTFKDADGKVLNVEGDFELSLKVDANITNPSVFHLSGDEKWEEIGGVFEKGFITVTVNHFSTYGVFAKESDEKSDQEKPMITIEDKDIDEIVKDEEQEGQLLPKTATPHFTMLLIGLTMMMLGFLIFLFRRRIFN